MTYKRAKNDLGCVHHTRGNLCSHKPLVHPHVGCIQPFQVRKERLNLVKGDKHKAKRGATISTFDELPPAARVATANNPPPPRTPGSQATTAHADAPSRAFHPSSPDLNGGYSLSSVSVATTPGLNDGGGGGRRSNIGIAGGGSPALEAEGLRLDALKRRRFVELKQMLAYELRSLAREASMCVWVCLSVCARNLSTGSSDQLTNEMTLSSAARHINSMGALISTEPLRIIVEQRINVAGSRDKGSRRVLGGKVSCFCGDCTSLRLFSVLPYRSAQMCLCALRRSSSASLKQIHPTRHTPNQDHMHLGRLEHGSEPVLFPKKSRKVWREALCSVVCSRYSDLLKPGPAVVEEEGLA